jgi:hypothetical protein
MLAIHGAPASAGTSRPVAHFQKAVICIAPESHLMKAGELMQFTPSETLERSGPARGT